MEARGVVRETPLLVAARYGRTSIVRMLLHHGADPNAKDSFGDTVLMVCLRERRPETACELIEYLNPPITVDVNTQNSSGSTPLHWAVDSGYLEVVQCLLKREDIDMNICNNRGQSPFYRAFTMIGSSREIVRLFAEHEKTDTMADATVQESFCPLVLALDNGWTHVARALLAKDVRHADEVDKSRITPLIAASGHEDLALVTELLKLKHLDVNARTETDRSSLSIAADMGYKEIMMALLKRSEIDIQTPDPDGSTPLQWALDHKFRAATKILLERGAFHWRKDVFVTREMVEAAERGEPGSFEGMVARPKNAGGSFRGSRVAARIAKYVGNLGKKDS